MILYTLLLIYIISLVFCLIESFRIERERQKRGIDTIEKLKDGLIISLVPVLNSYIMIVTIRDWFK